MMPMTDGNQELRQRTRNILVVAVLLIIALGFYAATFFMTR